VAQIRPLDAVAPQTYRMLHFFCGFSQTDSVVTDDTVVTGHSEFVSGKGGTQIWHVLFASIVKISSLFSA